MSFIKLLNVLLTIPDLIIPIVIDFLISIRLLKIRLTRYDKYFFILFGIAFFIIVGFASKLTADISGTFIEVITLFFYFSVIKRINTKLVLGSILTFTIFDVAIYLFSGVLIDTIPYGNMYFDSIISIIVEVIGYLIIKSYFTKLNKLITDKNSNIFIGILLYLYILGIGIEFFISSDKKTTEVVTISIGLLFLQAIFAFLLYFAMVKTENNLLSKKDQENQKLQNELLKTKNRELAQEKEIILKEQKQLKEYTDYLDKNEDELREFKHDYQNMMNGLIISAEKGNVDEVVTKLKDYTHSHINSKALRKYKGLNHVHVDFLKSIAIAKLAKLYNSNIDYTFGCDQDIDHIPKSVDYLDITRIIGIAFDNAFEESIALQKETGDSNSARVEAIYYQENGDFEFEIKNKIRTKNIDPTAISKKNYSTKTHHMGIGLANVKEIADKYQATMMVNYDIDDDWFTFSLIVLPDDTEE